MTLYQRLLKYRVIPILYFTLFIGIIAIGIWRFIDSGLWPLFKNPAALQDYFAGLGFKAGLTVFLLQLFGVVFIPATGGVIVVASAAALGFWETFIICSLATILGSCISFALARYLGKPLLDLFLNREQLGKYTKIFEKRENFLLFVMFFFPFFPDDILCYVAGLVKIKWKVFILAAALGRPWGLIINCLVGMSLFIMPKWAYVPAAVLVIAAIIISWKYGPRWEKRITAYFQNRKKDKNPKENC